MLLVVTKIVADENLHALVQTQFNAAVAEGFQATLTAHHGECLSTFR